MAVFTEQEIMQGSAPSVEAILENAMFLESGTSVITPKTVAVTENSAVQAMVVRFADIEALSEQYGCDYLEAMSAVVEANELDPNTFAVAVDEAEIIENPELMNELANVVINPQSENSFAYQFCEAMVDAWAESEEEAFLEAMVDDDVADKVLNELSFSDVKQKAGEYADKAKNAAAGAAGQAKAKGGQAVDWAKNNKVKTGLGVAALGGLAYGAKKLMDKKKAGESFNPQTVLKQAVGKDKNWIGKKIASLRSLYQKWLSKANAEKDAGRASAFKRVAASIMNVIDALMKKLEGSVGTMGKK